MLQNKKILITAGPTYEPIDPVRFIGNRSTGRMGIELTKAFLAEGASVILVLGPVSMAVPEHPQLQVVAVETAAQMFNACQAYFEAYDIAVFSAAVADYTPKHPAMGKIKKTEDVLVLELVKTKDILLEAGKCKKPNQVLVGFALETENEVAHAQQKLLKKNADCIVLNSLNEPGAGFKHATNKISILEKNGRIINFELKSKEAVARDIINYLKNYCA